MPDRRRAPQLSALDALTPDERAMVLARLVETNPDLASDAERLARELLASASVDETAADVADALLFIPLEVLGARCGRVRGRGYVHETEAAWELVSETVEPFLADVRRRATLELLAAAAVVATGIIAGLDRCRQAEAGTVVSYAGDDALDDLTNEVLRVAEELDVTLGPDVV